MPEIEQNLVGLVETVVAPIVENPEELEITSTVEDQSILIEIRVNPDDAGKVIGRQGRIIKAIRTLTRAAASRSDYMVDVELID
ncbi:MULTISPECIES: KH domain-containing protein [unclassified Adlercreutzia]|uniref:KH domain-containing protein n=1 Tax=unclassified Adlercreutzia TaxID=2636013 RepID=UPI0013EAA24C|nr:MULTISPECIES: KH domain-containing protein [unclassified Adlercreutzia]